MTALTGTVAAFGVGMAAGLGVAVPLGGIGVLLLQEGVERGWRRALPAATAVACVDVVYCAAAIAAGAALAPLVHALGVWPGVIGAVVLLAVGAVGFARGMRPSERPAPSAPQSGGRRRFALFVGLTAINPLTLIYFTAMAVALTQSSRTTVVIAVVAGVGLASALWHSSLAGIGAFFGARATLGVRRATVLVGNTVVAVFGALLLVRTIL